MKTDTRVILAIAGFLTLPFLFLGSLYTGDELVVYERWVLSLDQGTPSFTDPSTASQLRLPGFLLSLDSQARFRLFGIPDRVALGNNAWVAYGGNTQGPLELRDNAGSLLAQVGEASWFPVIEDQGLGLVSQHGQDLVWYDLDGFIKWRHSSFNPLVAIETFEDGSTLLYDLGARLVVLDESGKELHRWQGSRGTHKIGAGMIKLSETSVAVIEGLENQYVTVLDFSTSGFTERWSRNLGIGFSRDVLIQSMGGGGEIFVEDRDSFLVFDARDGSATRVPLRGWVRKVLELEGLDLLLIIRDSIEGSYLEAYDPKGQKRYSNGPHEIIHDVAVGEDGYVFVAWDEGVSALQWMARP